MELNEALLKRRSVRKFSPEIVSDEDIEKLMHAAMSGPSAMNKKPWEFYVVKNLSILSKVVGLMRYANYGANCAIIVAGNMNNTMEGVGRDFWIQDCSAATENILLKATELGLGTVWCGAYPDLKASDALRETLDAPENIVPLNVILVGHPLDEPDARDQYEKNKVHMIK